MNTKTTTKTTQTRTGKKPIDTTLDILNFIALTTAIAENYFREDGSYCPHLGMIEAMRFFYNYFIDNTVNLGKLKLDELQKVFNADFCEEFNKCISHNREDFSFGCAYRKAMELVELRKSSIGTAEWMIENSVQELTEKVSPELMNSLTGAAENTTAVTSEEK